MSKDFTKLRPFENDGVKVGDAIFSVRLGDVVTYIAGPDKDGKFCVNYNSSLYFTHIEGMKENPICWVENKPVYPGDLLHYLVPVSYSRNNNFSVERGGCSSNDVVLAGYGHAFIKDLTWVLPKVTHEGWLNIYPNNRVHPEIFKSKEDAEKSAYNARIACVRTEWVE